jgi:diguanylate cyclase (GGDEF)-like protein
LQQALAAAGRSGEKVALLIIDLDEFKAVNDGHGHEAGDMVLKTIAQRLREALRAEDTAGRIGGDEFVAVLPRRSDAQAAAQVAEKLIAAISRPVEVSGHALSVGASIGIAVFPDHGADADALSRAADQAMYTVKRTRKNAFAFAVGPGAEVA